MSSLWAPGDPFLSRAPPQADGYGASDRDLECDVVIVGTGPGGAACARALSLAGARVILVEEGPPESRFERHQGPTMRYHMQEGGAMVTSGTTTFPIAAGRGIGGGSLINSAIAWRAPDDVLNGWVEVLGDDRYSAASMAAAYDEMWGLLGIITTRVEVSGQNNDMIVRGVRALELDGGYLNRATPGCVGCGVCYYGCPSGGKASVNQNLLVDAAANGARIQADTKIDTILVEGERAVGVRGRMRHPDTNEPGGLLTVRAKKVVVAAGGIGTPRTLHHAGLAQRLGPAVGKGLHVHPGNAVISLHDERIEMWRGATQGAYFHPPDMKGCLPHSFSAPPEACLGLLQSLGVDAKAGIAMLPYLGGLVVMISDTGEGTVGAWSDGRADISYTFVDHDIERIKLGMLWAARVLLAGGAREVFAPVRGTGRYTDADALYAAVKDKPLADFTMYASHPMSTCRMGRDPSRSVIGPSGEAHGLAGLYLADSSIFPTSLGVNPSITTMAMAQRIGEGIAREG